ncbi:hypothetical protein LPAF129_15870 [Ligilactobacillus pabuli]|uniref:HK97 gp10 family phage protein n=1 Tax=Ligilactobacillus pabuli TaxID=2886039 RepID=A0ABQ5JIZ9_9LACO|nr:hypothetical protein LPAF129_15870 [Ligilactobacillus pabuli]
MDKVELKEGSLTNFKDQLEAVQKSDAYLFDINEAAKRAGGIQNTPKGNPGAMKFPKRNPGTQALEIKELKAIDRSAIKYLKS